MSDTRVLDKYWIENNFSYLESRLSVFPLFETSDRLYEDLGTLGEVANGNIRFKNAIALISSHLRIGIIPVSYGEVDQKNAGELHFSFVPVMKFPQKRRSFTADPKEIKISGWIKNIPDARERGRVIGAIISHELSHFCVISKGILRDTDDNERLTDLAIIILGLGNLYFNGSDIKKDKEHVQLGYLQYIDMVYALMKFREVTKISQEKLLSNLSPQARQKINGARRIVLADLEDYTRQENAELHEKNLGSIKSDLAQLKQKTVGSLSACQNISDLISLATKNQDIINRTHSFWNIGDMDNTRMGEFTINLHSATLQIRQEHVTSEMKDILRKIDNIEEEVPQKNPATDDLKNEALTLHDLDYSFSQFNEKVVQLSDEISLVISVQDKIFNQVIFLKKEISIILEKIQQCRELIKEIYSRHNFFCDNPVIWSEYLNDLNLSTQVRDLKETENYENIFGEINGYSTHLVELFSQPRENFPSFFNNIPAVRDLLIELKQRKESLVELKGRLFSIRASQIRHTSSYLEGNRHLLTHLNNNQDFSELDEKDIKYLKPKQKFLIKYYKYLEISNEDKHTLAEITVSLNNGNFDVELTRMRKKLNEIKNALACNIDRVQTFSDSSRIIPIDVHWKDYHPIAEEHKILHLRITRWAETQNKYIEQIRRMNLKSKSTLLEKSRKKIKDSFKDFI